MKQVTLLLLFVSSLAIATPCWAQQPFGSGASQNDVNQGGGNQGAGNGGGENPGAGGGAFADFDSLMELIETTVVPETWESLGGPSNMFPYPQGIYVDASGTIHQCDSPMNDDATEQLKSMLDQSRDESFGHFSDWKRASPLRFVSLRRLLDEKRRLGGVTPESLECLAGLSQIRYLFIEQDDIVIAGSVGGIESFQGWYRDCKSGRAAMRLDFLVTSLTAAFAGQPFGCTIDPTPQGLQRAAQVAADVKHDSMPIGAAPDAMVNALGMQRIEVFGTAGDTPIGYVMVEADRHMKQLALGIHPMPRAAKNYLDVIEETIDQGPNQDLLLRLWFTSKPRSVRANADRTIFEIAGIPMRLSGQNERALASGRRGDVTDDPRTAIFVDDFNDHWNGIRSMYPIYGALESIYQTASIAELIRRTSDSQRHRELLSSIAKIDTTSGYLMPTPRQVESIAVLHTFQRGRQRHHILIASGGVAVTPKQTLNPAIVEYPALASTTRPSPTEPRVVQQWWWDR